MKAYVFSLIVLLMVVVNVKAQSIGVRTEDGKVAEMGSEEFSQIATALEIEAQKTDDPKAQRLMEKVAAKLNAKSEELNSEKTPKLKKFGRNIGKGTVFLAVHTMKPLLRVSAFFTGFFEKADKNKDIKALYNLFLKNDNLFKDLYKEAETPDDFANLVIETFQEITLAKSKIIIRDLYRSLNLGVEIPDDITEFELTDELLDQVKLEDLDPSIVNNHPEYQDIKPFLGDLTQENIYEIIQVGGISDSTNMESYKKAMPKIHELSITAFTQAIGSTIVLASISGIVGAIYAVPVLAADVGAAISVAVCLNKKTQAKMLEDDELGQFCSYVTNWSSYQLMKSRMKGYLAGKKAKAKYVAWIKKMKDRRDARRERRRIRREANKA